MGVRKLFPLLELKQQRKKIELAEPWELVSRRWGDPARILVMKGYHHCHRKGRAGIKKYPDLPLLLSFSIIFSESPVLYLSVALFIASLMDWMISQNGVRPGILSCWTIQLNMIMSSTLTPLNTQVNEQFTVKCRNIWSHLHIYKQYLLFYMSTSGF